MSARSLPPRSEGFSLRLEIEGRPGRAIRLRLKVRNESAHPRILILGGRPAHDFLIMRPDGTVIWQWRKGRAVQQILEQRRMNPGQEVIFEATWLGVDQRGRRVPPGEYRVRGLLHTDPPQVLMTELLPLPVKSRGRR